jgi:hypothetical protein
MKPVRLFLFLVVENFKIEYQDFKKKFKDFWRRADSRKNGIGMGAIIITTGYTHEYGLAIMVGLFLGFSVFCLIKTIKCLVMGDRDARYWLISFCASFLCYIILVLLFNRHFQ